MINAMECTISRKIMEIQSHSCVHRHISSIRMIRCSRGRREIAVMMASRSGNGVQAPARGNISAVPDSLLAEVGFN